MQHKTQASSSSKMHRQYHVNPYLNIHSFIHSNGMQMSWLICKLWRCIIALYCSICSLHASRYRFLITCSWAWRKGEDNKHHKTFKMIWFEKTWLENGINQLCVEDIMHACLIQSSGRKFDGNLSNVMQNGILI